MTELDVAELQAAIYQLMQKTSPAIFTARVAEALEDCAECGVSAGEPCLPASGPERERRAVRNHAPHRTRRAAAAQRVAELICSAASSGGAAEEVSGP
jgi:hypothetical protein